MRQIRRAPPPLKLIAVVGQLRPVFVRPSEKVVTVQGPAATRTVTRPLGGCSFPWQLQRSHVVTLTRRTRTRPKFVPLLQREAPRLTNPPPTRRRRVLDLPTPTAAWMSR